MIALVCFDHRKVLLAHPPNHASGFDARDDTRMKLKDPKVTIPTLFGCEAESRTYWDPPSLKYDALCIPATPFLALISVSTHRTHTYPLFSTRALSLSKLCV